MYTIHTTPGLVISSQSYGEAGKLLYIFTREAGLILASAQGIRLEKSKLRYASQDYSFGEFSFVRGKEFWRLTDAKQEARREARPQRFACEAGREREFVARLSLLLKRLLNGEEAHPELFDVILATNDFLNELNDLTSEQMQALESITVARILHRLGYIGHDKDLNGYLESNELNIRLIDILIEKRTVLNKHINKAFKESQL